MLLYDDGALGFYHVPKNGGQSIRAALDARFKPHLAPAAEDLGMSEAEVAALFAGADGMVHPQMGRVRVEHLTLPFLRDHLPRTFEAFVKSRSLLVLREPRDRFFSAILQRLSEFQDMKGIRADDPVVTEEALRVCDWLDGRGAFPDMEYSHFTRQSDFVELDGERMVTALFPLSRTDVAEAWIAESGGESVAVEHTHARREPKPWAKPLQPVARFVGRNLIPGPIKRAIYPIWRASGAFEDASKRYDTIRLDDQVEQFITSYFARDIELLAEAEAALQQGKAA